MRNFCVGAAMQNDWGEDDWADDERPDITRQLLRRVFSYFRPHLRRGLLVTACIAAEAVIGLAPAVVFKALIDYLARPGGHFGHVAVLVGAGVGAALVGGLVNVAESYHSAVISQGIVFTLRRQLFENLVGQSVSFFTRSRSGDVLSRLGNDVGGVETVVADTVFGLVSNALVTAATLALMIRFSWELTLAVVVLIPLVGWPTRRFGKATYRARTRTQSKLAEMTVYLQEILGISGIMLVKAFVSQRREHARFGRFNDDLRGLQVREEMVGRWFGMLMSVLQTSAPALIFLFGGYLVLSGRSTVGTVFVFATVLGMRLGHSVSALATTQVNVVGSTALFKRLFDYIDLSPEIADRPGAPELPAVEGAISFDGVSVTYPGAGRPALRDISAEIAPGQLVALVGPSGAGKTTLSGLVPRFMDPGAGRVLVDGHDLRDVTLESLGSHVGVVFQDTFLFHASLRDNLLYARPGASEDELRAAARAAYLDELVSSLPEGLDTVVGERGHRLSGGEKQRVAIARVVLKDPRVLIFDEATSHLDTVSEQLIQAALQPLAGPAW